MEMTSYERVMTTVALKEPDRVPIIPRTKGFCMKYAGLKVNECFQNPDKYLAAQMRVIQDFGFDAVMDIYSGVPLYNEFFGGKLIFEENTSPSAMPFFTSIEDFKKLKPVNLAEIKRMNDIYEIVKKLKEEVRGNIPTIVGLPGVFRSAAQLRGIQDFYMDLQMNPGFVRDLLGCCLEMTKAYAEIVIEAGADIIFTSNSVASRDCISRKHYEQFVTGDEKTLNTFLKSKNKKIVHHTCGDWSDRFDLVVEEGADILFVSGQTDLKRLKDDYGNRICLMGNVDSVEVMFKGTAEQVEKESIDCIKKAGPGGGFILCNDCELPPSTPVANMKAMERAGKNFGRYPLVF